MSGGIVLMKGEEMKRAASWAEHHELIAEFQKHFKVGDLVLKRTITYGHPLFSGHRGEVNVYTWKE